MKGNYSELTNVLYANFSHYFGLISWFIILICAKLSHINTRKKLKKTHLLPNVIYGIVGGVFAYFSTATFQHNLQVVAIGFGVLGGDVLVGWIIDKTKYYLDILGVSLEKFLKGIFGKRE